MNGSGRSREEIPKCFCSPEWGNLSERGSLRGRVLGTRAGRNRVGGWFCPLKWKRCKRGKVYLLVMQLLLGCNQVTVISAACFDWVTGKQPKPETWARFETGQILTQAVTCSGVEAPAPILMQERCCAAYNWSVCRVETNWCLWDGEIVNRQIPLSKAAKPWHGCWDGMLSREGGLPFDLFWEPGFRNSRKQFKASVPSCSSKLFSEDGTIYSDRLFFFPDTAILHTPSLRLAEETVDAVVTVWHSSVVGCFSPFFHFTLLNVTLSFLLC